MCATFLTYLFFLDLIMTIMFGRAVAQAVSRRFPTAAARVRAQIRSCGICGGQSGTGTGFLRALLFTLPYIPLTAPHSSSSIIRGWYNRPVSPTPRRMATLYANCEASHYEVYIHRRLWYSPPHTVLKYSESTFFHQCDREISRPYETTNIHKALNLTKIFIS
jgi:hypothetical protein